MTGTTTSGIAVAGTDAPEGTPPPPFSRRALGASAAALVVAGVLLAIAAWIRWLPCVADIGSLQCALVQNHTLDYALVSEPFEPIPGAVYLAGAASLIIAAFWLGWARTLGAGGTTAPRPARAGIARVACFVAAALSAVTGVGQLLSASTNGEAGVLTYWAALAVGFIGFIAPLLAAIMLATLVPRGARGTLAWSLFALLIVASSTMVEFFVLLGFNGSYDSPPGTGYFAAAALVLTGFAFGVSSLLRPPAPRGSAAPAAPASDTA